MILRSNLEPRDGRNAATETSVIANYLAAAAVTCRIAMRVGLRVRRIHMC